MIPPGMRRVLMSSPVLGVTLLIFLLILVFYVRTSPTSTLPTLSKSTLPDVALPSPKAELDTGPIKPDPGDITLPDLPDLYTPYFPTFRLPTALLHLPLLAVKLHTFLTRPITSHTPESEDEEHRLCPARLSDRLVNPDQLRGDRDFWRGVDTAEIARRRTDVVKWLDRRVERGEAVLGGEGVGQGRGIVLTGGNQVSPPFGEGRGHDSDRSVRVGYHVESALALEAS